MNIFLRIGNAIERRKKWITVAGKKVQEAAKESAKEAEEFKKVIKFSFDAENFVESLVLEDMGYNGSNYTATLKRVNAFVPAPPLRLRFKAGEYRVEIIIGNPVTACRVTQDDDVHDLFSVCNYKDTYDWKTGAIRAMENVLRADWRPPFDRATRAMLFDAMFKKYPELRRK